MGKGLLRVKGIAEGVVTLLLLRFSPAPAAVQLLQLLLQLPLSCCCSPTPAAPTDLLPPSCCCCCLATVAAQLLPLVYSICRVPLLLPSSNSAAAARAQLLPQSPTQLQLLPLNLLHNVHMHISIVPAAAAAAHSACYAL